MSNEPWVPALSWLFGLRKMGYLCKDGDDSSWVEQTRTLTHIIYCFARWMITAHKRIALDNLLIRNCSSDACDYVLRIRFLWLTLL